MLIRRVEKFLRETGMPCTTFGRLATRDPRLVRDLRNGREPGPVTERRIDGFIASYRAKLGRSAMRDERRKGSGRRRLVSALMALSDEAGVLVRHDQKPWASVTFSGARHTVVLQFAGSKAVEAGERLIAAIPEHEFTLAGQLVADAAVVAAEQTMLPEPRLTVEAEVLLLEEW